MSQIGIGVCRLLPQGRVSYISIMPHGHIPHNPFPFAGKDYHTDDVFSTFLINFIPTPKIFFWFEIIYYLY